MSRSALVIGAGGALGEAIAARLLGEGWRVCAAMRRPHPEAAARLQAAGAELARLDLEASQALAPLSAGREAIFCTARLDLASSAAAQLATTPGRLLVFSSNNVGIDPDAPIYRALAAAERELRAARPDLTIVRPTMIYGDPRLPTLGRVMAFARRWPLLPVPGSGRARVQPVFHGDLARLAVGLIDDAAAQGATFAAGGPDVVSMAALFACAAAAAGRAPLIVPTPGWALRAGAGLLGERFPLDRAQIARAERDRLAAAVDSLPAALAPQTPLSAGLAALARALGYS